MEHALHLLILLLATRLLGELFERLRQPASIGEIGAGVLLALLATAPITAPVIGELPHSPFLEVAAEFGIFFLVLFAGLEIRPREMIDHSQRTFWVATGGVLVPLGSGFALAWLFLPETPLKLPQALLVGVGLSISALPVSVKVLRELDLLHTPVGNTIVSAAVFDDVIGLFLLAVVLSLIETGASLDAIQAFALLGKIALFFVLTVVLGWYGMPRVMKAAAAFRVPSPVFSALLVIALGFAFLAELLGMDFILGPFMAGLFFDPKTLGRDAYESVKGTIQTTTDGLLGPLFFASIGARVDLSAVSTVPVFLGALLAAAFLGKLLGAGVPARLSGLTTRQSTAVGVGLSGRGAVELIIASIALEAGLFDHPDPVVANLFSALVITAVVTTIVMPVGLRLILDRAPNVGGVAR
ncbi:MAG: cation:proton antiporter [Gammaproteobacteria bacterium]|nr:cation:proton antiporter [Gammaproteobacteria bacterium]NIP89573.1 cation:proton antiporter [Gammaproteobacteria bacterium]NIS06075.1 cation:proton antiporter [Gammaproteobacteria bacterium]NIU41313.1 cation:proton antiporter [Gammaproteobacteria bacterium]NIV48779.1 cation:proton antiporter [Gammaproteobacteria bacterium]